MGFDYKLVGFCVDFLVTFYDNFGFTCKFWMQFKVFSRGSCDSFSLAFLVMDGCTLVKMDGWGYFSVNFYPLLLVKNK